MSATRFAFRIARRLAWGRAISRALAGNPTALVKRVRNKYLVFRPFGRYLRK